MDNMERIAVALERIAASLEKQERTTTRRIVDDRTAKYLRAMKECGSLRGRMTIEGIAAAIDMEVTPSDRVAIGNALTMYGALKSKSGSTRYYIFK